MKENKTSGTFKEIRQKLGNTIVGISPIYEKYKRMEKALEIIVGGQWNSEADFEQAQEALSFDPLS